MSIVFRIVMIVGLLLASRVALAQGVPPQRLSLLMLRILAYDRNLEKRASETVTIAAVHRAGDRKSEAVCSEITKALERSAGTFALSGRKVQVVSVPYSRVKAFETAMEESEVAALYGCPGLGSMVGDLSVVTRRHSILSFTSDAGYLTKGFSIGLLAVKKKVIIRINLSAARAEGADLDPVLLRVAEVIK